MKPSRSEARDPGGGRFDAASQSLSVVYPTLDRPEMIVRSLRALLANTQMPDEIVVVDQSRGDGTRRALEELGSPLVSHVASSLRGLSNARNTGIENSRFPILGFIDDDCIPARNWVEAARRAIRRNPDSAIWIGQDYPDPEAISEEVISSHVERCFSVRRRTDPWKLGPTGGNSFFRRTTFDQVGLFDPELGQGSVFPGAEDGDMVYRVLRHGLQVTYTDSIRVHHLGWRSEEQNEANSYNYGLGVGALMAKFAGQGDYYPLMVIFTRRFLSKYLAVPCWFLLGRKHKYRSSLKWSQSMIHGYLGWRRLRRSEASGEPAA